jgi:hypothetical protein
MGVTEDAMKKLLAWAMAAAFVAGCAEPMHHVSSASAPSLREHRAFEFAHERTEGRSLADAVGDPADATSSASDAKSKHVAVQTSDGRNDDTGR